MPVVQEITSTENRIAIGYWPSRCRSLIERRECSLSHCAAMWFESAAWARKQAKEEEKTAEEEKSLRTVTARDSISASERLG